jgi:NADH-quinone oxidoreductase subunit L
VAAVGLYRGRVSDPLPGVLGAAAGWLRDRFYFDELYGVLVRWTQEALARVADTADRWLVAGVLVRGTAGTVAFAGWLIRRFQTGNLQTYSLLMAGGTALLLWWLIEW